VGRILHALALSLLLGRQEREPSEELDARAEFHIGAAELAEGTPEGAALALYHWERVLDCCDSSPESRLRARKALGRLRKAVPPETDPKKAAAWRVLGVVFGGVNWNNETDPKQSARYRVGHATIQNVKKGYDAFCKRVAEVSRGTLRVEPKFHALEQDVRSLYPYSGNRVLMYPGDYEKNKGPKPREGEFDLVIVYLISRDPLPWDSEVLWAGRYQGAAFVNLQIPDGTAQENAETGGREFGIFSQQVRDAFVERAGFARALFPADPTEDDRAGQERCFDANRKPAEYVSHLLEDHTTSLMWRQVSIAPTPAAPFIRNWLLRGPFEAPVDPAAKPPVDETDPDLSLKDWIPHAARTDYIDLRTLFRRQRPSVAYAATYVYAKKKGWLRISFGEAAYARVFWDGREVWLDNRNPRDPERDAHAVRVLAEEGRHLLVFKLRNDTAGYTNEWGFFCRLLDPLGGVTKAEAIPVKK
jgi:hypothetical protein